MNSDHLKLKLTVADVTNILQITKVHKEMDVVNDLTCINHSTMHEEDVIISKQLENITEMTSAQLKLKMKVDDVANILQITKVNKEMDIVNNLTCITHSTMNEDDVVISKRKTNSHLPNNEKIRDSTGDINVKVIDENITEIDQPYRKIENIISQSNVSENDTHINISCTVAYFFIVR